MDRTIRAAQGEAARRHLTARVDLGAYEVIGIYWPMRGEIDVRELARLQADRGGLIALPVVVAPAAPVEFWRWVPGMTMRHGVWNIPIPAEREVVVPQALIVPLVGYDAKRYRLGYGGGYYDRTLAASRARPVCIGLGYKEARLDSIYPQPHDVPMDMIITDDENGSH